jgi:hypothetical protein
MLLMPDAEFTRAEAESVRLAEEAVAFLRAASAETSPKRKAKSWGHIKLKLTFRDGLITLCEINDKTIRRVNS